MIQVYRDKVTQQALAELAKLTFIEMVKGVVDLKLKIIALGGDLHADCEEVLLEQGSRQGDLWGFNIYIGKSIEERIEYTSMINIRPRQGNLSREVQDPQLRIQIKTIIDHMVES